MLLLETYEETYDIHQHDDINRPLSLIAHHDTEDYQKNSLEYQILKRFAVNRVGKHFNVSLGDYLNLPISTQNIILDISMEMDKEIASIGSDLAEELQEN